MNLRIQPQVFAILRGLIEERIGLRYGLEDSEILGDKLMTRALEAGFESLLDYYYFLRYDPASEAEFSALTDALVVNETYFFREYDQLKLIVDDFIVPSAIAGNKPRVWSAACSTGEEPFTIAMMLADCDRLADTEIVGTDISERALARARANEFGVRALRPSVNAALSSRWIEAEQGRPVLAPSIRSSVTFRKQNLLDADGVRALGTFDVILCRNVMIYFSDETIERVIQNLSMALRPNGVLCVGVSESLMRFAGPLVCEERRGIFVYRKTS